MIGALDTSSSGVYAQRTRMDVIAGNIANAFTTQREDGTIEPYRRRFVRFTPERDDGGPGVRVAEVAEDPSPYRLQYSPGHPHADAEGYVRFPNVNLTLEYVDAMEAARAYEANVAMMEISKDMVEQGIRLFA